VRIARRDGNNCVRAGNKGAKLKYRVHVRRLVNEVNVPKTPRDAFVAASGRYKGISPGIKEDYRVVTARDHRPPRANKRETMVRLNIYIIVRELFARTSSTEGRGRNHMRVKIPRDGSSDLCKRQETTVHRPFHVSENTTWTRPRKQRRGCLF